MEAVISHPLSAIGETFKVLRGKSQIALMPFVAAGYPDAASTVATIGALTKAGASLVEIGFPFSDPIADGPTIQEAFTEALAKKIKVVDVFECVRKASQAGAAPMVGMLSYSIVFRYGLTRFVADSKAAGLSGLIIPDLPPPEAQRVCDTIRTGGLDTILLVAPSTPPERRRVIASLCSGFVYYLSVSGITGERDRLPDDVLSNVRQLREMTDRPICVGFGIYKAEQVASLRGVADGAIVGSALVKRMKNHASDGPDVVAQVAGSYCRELLSMV